MLETDKENARAYVDAAILASRAYYLARIHDGLPPACARCAAIAYLARKTRWSWPYAAGTFDHHKETPK